METPKEKSKKTGLFAVIGSVFAAAFGVQSSKNRERDFTQGRLINYVIAGIIFVAVFIVSVFTVVQMVLK
ncbi:Uncharacterised protein [Zhongshania aliphaticivorans]|uniref:DUF2970 domain-containing protein n=1 Tax=Zhongshania aliphaticivorans TaxID=1470434 RepID=A0A5S9NYQ6_9GAMM|nr:DUF2970 domain-containing protein [Zhongshania aliphaticivorans]CAA0089234.1 Uncharacterised protein [Zhongshania aliphaticivorans]CAA0095926.1 Uncharacterised protein [Zhongshania aliphaticivorans]